MSFPIMKSVHKILRSFWWIEKIGNHLLVEKDFTTLLLHLLYVINYSIQDPHLLESNGS